MHTLCKLFLEYQCHFKTSSNLQKACILEQKSCPPPPSALVKAAASHAEHLPVQADSQYLSISIACSIPKLIPSEMVHRSQLNGSQVRSFDSLL